MIKAIGFDWGGVLVPSKPIVPGIAQIIGMTQEDLYRYYLSHNYKAGVENMPYEDLWASLMHDLGHSDKVEAILEHIKQQQTFETDERMLELVSKLKGLDYKVGLLSNNTTAAGDRIRGEGLHHYFDTFLISGEIGFQKPDPRAFDKLFSDLEVVAGETVFIDDSTSSLSTASEIGYTPILFSGYDDLVDSLTELEVLQ